MTHRLSLSTTPSIPGFPGYMANALSPQPSPMATSTASGVTTGGGATELATFYIHSALHRSGQFFHVNKPADIPNTPPVAIKRPKFPEMRQLSMRMLTPCILYVQYPCEQKCRNLGICIHYQFVVGCKKCPDGLRCEFCVGSGVEEAIQAGRRCPLHQDAALPNLIGSRPEDFLATDTQKQICDEVLTRSFACDWDDVPTAVAEEQPTTINVSSDAFVSMLPHSSALSLSTLDTEAPSFSRPTPRPAIAHAFDRESTPRTMHDVKMLETVPEEDEGESEGEGQDKGFVEDMASLTEYHPDHGLHTNRRFFNFPRADMPMPMPPVSGFSGGPLDMAAGIVYGRMGQRV